MESPNHLAAFTKQFYLPINNDGSNSSRLPNIFFMLKALLASRLEVNRPSVAEEQDVNIYLAQLLCSYIDPSYVLWAGNYLSAYDHELFERIHDSNSQRLKYTVYRVNADYMMMSIGVFRQTSFGHSTMSSVLRSSLQMQIGRAQAYYDYAATFGGGIFGRASAVPQVLSKLALGFEKYVRVLGHLREEYLNLVEHISQGELYHLQREAQAKGLEELHNEFLDALRVYQGEPTPERRGHLLETVQHIQRFQPDFHFEMPA